MSIHVEIPEPLAEKVQDAARSLATSPQHYVLDAITKTLAENAVVPSNEQNDPLLGLFSDQADLIDTIVEEAMDRRRSAPLRAPCE
ncbi:hypothetical protein [Bythopirellula polymerisocia]|uniref:Uncharacterized protein n=1 Tax=Bythopirellula polymerisocia TaxID=2528003 RepID=A0A5C6CZ35_9BACT|nr:hypothetical protein [Bythopirellula polymerisocia]TWU29850.1 hypothetical protein Pla144_06300 [Bythopirellula polymerisocia]